MAIAFEVGIGDLFAKFFAHAFDIFAFSHTTGTIAAFGL